ncbi:unnamed protein product [Aphanomyces euteiches]
MSMTLNGATEVFRPLTTAWYHPSEFPVEIVQESSQPHVLNKLICECKHQTTFDIETFLRSLLDTYAAFRPFHLHDYDLRYLCVSESSWIYMCGALDLERIDVPTWRRVGVFFAWNALDGAFKKNLSGIAVAYSRGMYLSNHNHSRCGQTTVFSGVHR